MRKILITVLVFLSFRNLAIAGETWQNKLENSFDIVSTFDDLQDWVGTSTNNDCPSEGLPLKLDGSPSLWGRYCYYGLDTPVDQRGPWISDFGTNRQVGSKALLLGNLQHVKLDQLENMVLDSSGNISSADLKPTAKTEQKAPAYMTMYFGNGQPSTDPTCTNGGPHCGYSEIYIFFRLGLHKNGFPTRIINSSSSIVDYVNGEKYLYISSGKFLNLNTGFSTATVWNDEWSATNQRQYDTRYGDTEIWYHLKADPNMGNMVLETFFSKNHYNGILGNNGLQNKLFDHFGAIEFHMKLEEPAGASNGISEIWVYDENGNAELIAKNTNVRYRPDGADYHLFNRLQLEGNKHIPSIYIYKCGPNMDCKYNIDDFILNGDRIGPTYFSLLKNELYSPTGVNGGLGKN